jgi:hypothetical protein
MRYLVSASPYSNGSYLVPTSFGSLDEYTLYCACSIPSAVTRWKSREMVPCEISKGIHLRGYGSPDEVLPIPTKADFRQSFDVTPYLDFRLFKKRDTNHAS